MDKKIDTQGNEPSQRRSIKLLIFLLVLSLATPLVCAYQDDEPCCDFGYIDHYVRMKFYNFDLSYAKNETVTVTPMMYQPNALERLFFPFMWKYYGFEPDNSQQRTFTTDENGEIVLYANENVRHRISCKGYTFDAYLVDSLYTVGLPDCKNTSKKYYGCLI